MQPHSMCAIMVAHYYWNHNNPKKKADGDIAISYSDRNDRTVTKYYKFYNVSESSDLRQLTATFQTPDGRCDITIRRSSPEEGSDAELIHSVQHASNLRERFKMYKHTLRGYHENSLKYRSIDANLSQDCRIEFRNEVRLVFDNTKFKTTVYDVRLLGG